MVLGGERAGQTECWDMARWLKRRNLSNNQDMRTKRGNGTKDVVRFSTVHDSHDFWHSTHFVKT